MEANNEKPIIFAVVTVFLTFTLVYLAFFRTQSVNFFSPVDISSETGTVVDAIPLVTGTTRDVDTLLSDTNGRVDLNATTSIAQSGSSSQVILSSGSTLTTVSSSSSLVNTFSTLKKKVDALTIISPRYNSIKIAETLALDVNFAFSDTGSIQYGYLGTGSIDTISSPIKRLGGNIVAIETQNDILKNGLRGDRILFINIPQVTLIRTNGAEKRLLVTFVVEIGSDKWLVQAPADRYYTSKQRMKSLFEQIYGKML